MRQSLIDACFVENHFDFRRLKGQKDLQAWLVDQTSFLDETASSSQRAWHVYHNLSRYPLCSGGNLIKTFISFGKGYTKTCREFGTKRICCCWAVSAEKKKVTMLERYRSRTCVAGSGCKASSDE